MEEGITQAHFFVGKADCLSELPSKSFDIVLTDALLILFGPDRIMPVIEQMIRLASRWLVLVEWHCEHQAGDPHGLGAWHFGRWKRNYVNLLTQFKPHVDSIRLTKIPEDLWPDKDWAELGYIIEASIIKGGKTRVY